jgi:hypothetical protein
MEQTSGNVDIFSPHQGIRSLLLEAGSLLPYSPDAIN